MGPKSKVWGNARPKFAVYEKVWGNAVPTKKPKYLLLKGAKMPMYLVIKGVKTPRYVVLESFEHQKYHDKLSLITVIKVTFSFLLLFIHRCS